MNEIFVGNCVDIMKGWKKETIDLVVTSPPYNIGIGDDRWEDSLPWDEYLELTRTWLTECYRVLVDGGIICVNLPANCRNNIASLHDRMMRELGFNFKTNIVWVKWDWDREEKFAVSKWRLDKFRFPSKHNPLSSLLRLL